MQTSSIPQPEELKQNKLIFVGEPHSSLQLEQRIYKYALLGLLISAVLFLLLGTYTNIDLRIEDYYYNLSLAQFLVRLHLCARVGETTAGQCRFDHDGGGDCRSIVPA